MMKPNISFVIAVVLLGITIGVAACILIADFYGVEDATCTEQFIERAVEDPEYRRDVWNEIAKRKFAKLRGEFGDE